MSWKLLLSKKIINENEENNNNNKQRKNMNIKKIGMTALAASLVSTSVFAGELTATGSASLTVEGYSGTILNSDTAYSMADSVMLTGSTELDNGLTVAMSFELDGDNEDADGTSSYDSNKMTISSDAMGTLVFHAHGGDSATGAIDASAAGDIFDNFDGAANGLTVTGVADGSAALGNNGFHYTLPSMVDGLAVTASLNTAGTTGNNALGFAGAYSGVEGLSVSYGVSDIETGASGTSGDQTVMKASYAYGPITVGYSSNEIDLGTATSDKETTAWGVSYTVSEAISVSYGQETIDVNTTLGVVDAEYEGISASYTSGGMTVSVKSQEATNIDNTVDTDNDYDYWSLGLSFAF
jgi:outer membrane protein OmpU